MLYHPLCAERHQSWLTGVTGHMQTTYMRQLIGGIFAASVLLQGSFLIGAQDFGRWAMPFGFCDRKKELNPQSPM